MRRERVSGFAASQRRAVVTATENQEETATRRTRLLRKGVVKLGNRSTAPSLKINVNASLIKEFGQLTVKRSGGAVVEGRIQMFHVGRQPVCWVDVGWGPQPPPGQQLQLGQTPRPRC